MTRHRMRTRRRSIEANLAVLRAYRAEHGEDAWAWMRLSLRERVAVMGRLRFGPGDQLRRVDGEWQTVRHETPETP